MAERTHDNELYDNHGELELAGSANAYTATTARAITGYFKGLRICGKANHTNTGASTLNINGIGAKAIRSYGTVALAAGDIVSGAYHDFLYDATNDLFQMTALAGNFVKKSGDTMTGSLTVQGAIKSTSPSGGVGYGTGAGAAVTQITSRATGVTVNAVCGAITLFSDAGLTTVTSFLVTNSAVAETDTIKLTQRTGTNIYHLLPVALTNGSFIIVFYTTGGTAVDAPIINFSVTKAVAA